MKRSIVIGIVVLVVIVLAFIGYYSFGSNNYQQPISTDNNPPGPPSSINLPVESGDNEIKIENFAFLPAILTIKVGDTVTWVNLDSVQHTVTSDSGSELNSEMLSKGESYSHTFASAGTYDYHCKPHPRMTAKIIVE